MILDCERRNRSKTAGRSSVLLAVLLGVVAWAGLAPAEDAPEPPPSPPLERLFEPVKEAMKDLPPFLRDTDLKIHFRTYYLNREKSDGATENEAWAFGGWVSYKSGWLFDTFGIGATFYGSAPLYAPDDKDGTLLLKPGQEGYYVLGEAYAALRYQDYALLKGYRQLVDQSYINPQDNRMTPNTFEGVTLGGKVDWVQYLAGYLWEIKPRNSDEFISMAEQAGATGQRRRRHHGRRAADPHGGLADRPHRAVRHQYLQHDLRGGRVSPPAQRRLEAEAGRPVHRPARGRRRAGGQRGRQELEHPGGRRAGPGDLQGADPDGGRSRSRPPATRSSRPGEATPAISR